MSFFDILGNIANGTAESLARRQAASAGPRPRKGAKRKGGCAPCQAIAGVENARKKLGFKSG